MTINLFGNAVKSLPQQVDENTHDIKYLKARYPFKLKGDFDVTEKYVENDLVSYNESSYIAKQEVQGVLPDNKIYWQLIASCNADIATLEKNILKNEVAITNIEVSIDEYKKEVKKEFDTKVDKLSQFIPGEYKYMNVSATMPPGWVKVTSPKSIILTSNEYTPNGVYNQSGNNGNNPSITWENNDNLSTNVKFIDSAKTAHYEYNYLNCNLWIYDPKKEFTK